MDPAPGLLQRNMDASHAVTISLSSIFCALRNTGAAMKITKIRYRKLISLPDAYSHQAVELEAEVEPGEDPDAAMLDLKHEVERQLADSAERHRLYRDMNILLGEIAETIRERDQVRHETETLRSALMRLRTEARIGNVDDGLPF